MREPHRGAELILLVACLGVVAGIALGPGAQALTPSADVHAAGPATHAPLNLPPTQPRSAPLLPTSSGGLGTEPGWLAYDSDQDLFYVAAPPSDVAIATAAEWGGVNVTGAIPVGLNPFGVAYDPSTNAIFVTNTGSSNVSVIAGGANHTTATIWAGSAPTGIAVDPWNGDIYVADSGEATVTVVSGVTLTVLATVPVGNDPMGIAVDPSSGDVFVADHDSAEVTVISGSTNEVITGISVGAGPYGATFDNESGNVYVTEEGVGDVAVISAGTDSVVAVVPVGQPGFLGFDLQGVAFDWGDGLVWAAAGHSYVAVIDPSIEGVTAVVNVDPAGIAYDPTNGDVCVTNTANVTFECFQFSDPYSTSLVQSIQFYSPDLPAGTSWSVSLNIVNGPTTNVTSPNGRISFWALAWTEPVTCSYQIVGPLGWVASPASGVVNGTGPPVVVNVSFTAQRLYTLTFEEDGLPNGTAWTLSVSGPTGGFGGTFTQNSISVQAYNGTYSYSVGTVLGYQVAPASGMVVVAGANATVQFRFAPYPMGSFLVTFDQTGGVALISWTVTLVNTTAFNETEPNQGNVIVFVVPNGSYNFTVTDPLGLYVPDPASGTIVVAGSNLTILVRWLAPHEFSVNFSEVGLPTGTNWTVALGHNNTQSASTASIAFLVQNGTYEYAVSPLYGYSNSPVDGWVTVDGQDCWVNVTFQAILPGEFEVAFVESGLPAGTAWSVELAGVENSSVTSTITFAAPAGTYAFHVDGVPGWTTTNYNGSLVVNGTPVIQFVAWTETNYSVVFTEEGLPSELGWTVEVSGPAYDATVSTNTTSAVFQLPNGSYSFEAQPSGRWAPIQGGNGSFAVDGLSAAREVTYAFTTNVTISIGTAPAIGSWMAEVTLVAEPSKAGSGLVGMSWFANSSGSSIAFNLPNGTFTSAITASGYQTTTQQFSVSGAPPSQQLAMTLQPNASAGTPVWVWLVTGLALGAVVAIAAVILVSRVNRPPPAP